MHSVATTLLQGIEIPHNIELNIEVIKDKIDSLIRLYQLRDYVKLINLSEYIYRRCDQCQKCRICDVIFHYEDRYENCECNNCPNCKQNRIKNNFYFLYFVDNTSVLDMSDGRLLASNRVYKTGVEIETIFNLYRMNDKQYDFLKMVANELNIEIIIKGVIFIKGIGNRDEKFIAEWLNCSISTIEDIKDSIFL